LSSTSASATRIDDARPLGDSEVDAAGRGRLEGEKRLGDLERAVVAQQHAPGADADAPRPGGEQGDHQLRAGVAGVVDVVLGHPKAPVAGAEYRDDR